jgi:hypothetical protein
MHEENRVLGHRKRAAFLRSDVGVVVDQPAVRCQRLERRTEQLLDARGIPVVQYMRIQVRVIAGR